MTVFRQALSVSPFARKLLSDGLRFTDGKNTATTLEELQALFVAYGSTEVFCRIATTRRKAVQVDACSLDEAIAYAEMAVRLGLQLNPEFGLFSSYGDVLRQPSPDFGEYPELDVPGPWETLTIDQMCEVVGRYGAFAAERILATGAEVNVWDIGNEVDLGIAGIAPLPLDAAGHKVPKRLSSALAANSVRDIVSMAPGARIAWLSKHVWPDEAAVLAAFAEGVRTVVPDAVFSTHLSGMAATDAGFALAFWEAMNEAGYLPDELGLSFYPSSPNSALALFQETVLALREAFDRPVFVAEYSYPAEPMSGQHLFADWNREEPGYPLDEGGQDLMLADLTRWGATHGLSGIRPWAPDFATGLWAPMALFRPDGDTLHARTALGAMARALSDVSDPETS